MISQLKHIHFLACIHNLSISTTSAYPQPRMHSKLSMRPQLSMLTQFKHIHNLACIHNLAYIHNPGCIHNLAFIHNLAHPQLSMFTQLKHIHNLVCTYDLNEYKNGVQKPQPTLMQTSRPFRRNKIVILTSQSPSCARDSISLGLAGYFKVARLGLRYKSVNFGAEKSTSQSWSCARDHRRRRIPART